MKKARKKPDPKEIPPPAKSRRSELWTIEEDEIVLKNYRKKGSAYTAALIGRSYTAVQSRALKLGIAGYGQRWKRFEVRYLQKRYGKIPNASIARTLHRTKGSVYAKAQLLRLGGGMGRTWTERELEYLRANYHKQTNGRIALALRRTPAAVELKAGRLKLRRRVHLLTQREKTFIVKHAGKMSFVDLAKRFGVHSHTVRVVLLAVGYRDRPTSRPWTAKDDARLRELYGTMKRTKVAELLGRTMVATAFRASDLGLTREVKGGRRSRERKE